MFFPATSTFIFVKSDVNPEPYVVPPYEDPGSTADQAEFTPDEREVGWAAYSLSPLSHIITFPGDVTGPVE